jgi:hypothetical protein
VSKISGPPSRSRLICCRLFRAIEHGDPKEARIFADGGHMGRVPGQRNDEALAVATQWLKRRLTEH